MDGKNMAEEELPLVTTGYAETAIDPMQVRYMDEKGRLVPLAHLYLPKDVPSISASASHDAKGLISELAEFDRDKVIRCQGKTASEALAILEALRSRLEGGERMAA